MSAYNVDGEILESCYNVEGLTQNKAYKVDGKRIFPDTIDYSDYSVEVKWGSKGVNTAQGFDIYDGKVYWVSKIGNSSVEANCYIWLLSNGEQAFTQPYTTIYSGHGNNLCFSYPYLYASTAYNNIVYINTISQNLDSFTLTKTLVLNDGSIDLDVCIDENDSTILWSIGHTASHTDTSAPFNISKWDLSDLTDNGDDTYSPALLQTISSPQPECFFFQGCKMHDNLLWYSSGYSGSSYDAYVYGVNPNTGKILHTIDCGTTSEPEGIAFVEDSDSFGGYALYAGFQGMAMRKILFN